MMIDIKIEQYPEYLNIVVSGTYNLDEAINRFPLILSVCLFTGITKVIIDYRNLEGIPPEATNKIIYAFGIQEHYQDYLNNGGKELNIAYVQSSPISSYEPGAEIIKERNYSWELFTDINEAHKWLKV